MVTVTFYNESGYVGENDIYLPTTDGNLDSFINTIGDYCNDTPTRHVITCSELPFEFLNKFRFGDLVDDIRKVNDAFQKLVNTDVSFSIIEAVGECQNGTLTKHLSS